MELASRPVSYPMDQVMWLFKKVGEEYHVGYLTNEQCVDNGRQDNRFIAQVKGLDFIGAMRMTHYLNGGESMEVNNALIEEARVGGA